MTAKDMTTVPVLLTMSDAVAEWSGKAYEVLGIVTIGFFIINSYVLVSIFRERSTQRKHFMESHG